MSRVGRQIINIPAGVTIQFENQLVTVTGQKGTLTQEIKKPISVIIDGSVVRVERGNDAREAKALHGLYNKLIRNMVEGVSKGWTKTLILNGVGYKAAMKGNGLLLNIGYSHPCEIAGEEGITFKVLTPQEIAALNLGKEGIGQVVQVNGASREQVGAVASNIRGLRPVEPYHLYGIRYSTEKVIRKESKSGAKGGKK